MEHFKGILAVESSIFFRTDAQKYADNLKNKSNYQTNSSCVLNALIPIRMLGTSVSFIFQRNENPELVLV